MSLPASESVCGIGRQASSPSTSPSGPAGPSGSVWWDEGDEDRDGQEYAWEQRLMDEALDGAAGVHSEDWYMCAFPLFLDRTCHTIVSERSLMLAKLTDVSADTTLASLSFQH